METISQVIDNSKKLLIVDDEVLQQTMLKGPLARKQIETVFCTDGLTAIETIKKDQGICLVLLDLVMPKMDGFKTVQEIRSLDLNVPVFAVSASASEDDKEKIKDFGFNGILLKPLNINDIDSLYQQCSNTKTINDIEHKDNFSDKKTIIRHLSDQRVKLEIAIKREDQIGIMNALHGIRENVLIENFKFITQSIEKIQKKVSNLSVAKGHLIELNTFLKEIVNANMINNKR